MSTRRTLLRGGRVRSPVAPGATALVVEGATVAWVGVDSDAPTGCDETVELDGAVVLPAFVDAHVHLTQTGLALAGLDLAAAPSLAVAMELLADYAREHSDTVVLGTGWDETRWPEHRPPTAADLDAATDGALVYLSRVDAHSAVVSTGLAAAASVSTPDGLVRLAVHHEVRRAAYASISREQRTEAQRSARAYAAARGVAALHEMGGPEIAGEADFLSAIAIAAHEPGPEVVGYWGELGAVERIRDLRAIGAGGDLFVDGSVGSHTAWLSAPYADDTGNGHAWFTTAEIRDHVVACVEAGVQTGFHAIGDAAIATVVAGFAAAAEVVGAHRVAKGRHRIEHAELDPPAMDMARLGLVASVQPAFDTAWGGESGMYVERLGADRARRMNPFAGLAGAGVVLAFGSDAPVTPIDPWGTIRAAVRHRTPAHRLDYEAAFLAHTRGGHAAARDESAGTLVPGAPASYAVWNTPAVDASTGLPVLDAPDPSCLRTAVRGTVVFDTVGVRS